MSLGESMLISRVPERAALVVPKWSASTTPELNISHRFKI
jgi:hypothetical protein